MIEFENMVGVQPDEAEKIRLEMQLAIVTIMQMMMADGGEDEPMMPPMP